MTNSEDYKTTALVRDRKKEGGTLFREKPMATQTSKTGANSEGKGIEIDADPGESSGGGEIKSFTVPIGRLVHS